MENIQQFLPLAGMIIVGYFFLIRPQITKQKKEQEFANSLKKGSKVITKGGIHGRIVAVSDNINAYTLETEAGKLVFDKSAISYELTQNLKANTN